MILPNLQAAFFDFDGTLADTYDCLEQTHQRVMEKLGVPSPKKAGWFHDYFGKERTFIYNSLYGADKAEEARAIFTDYVRNHSADLVRPLEGAEDILKFLQAHGIPMTIVTNKAYDIVIKEIEAFGWNHYFQAVIGAGDAEADKPSPAPIHLAAKRIGYTGKPEEIWFVGDTEADLAAANAAKVTAILYGPKKIQNEGAYKIDVKTPDHADFLAILHNKGL